MFNGDPAKQTAECKEKYDTYKPNPNAPGFVIWWHCPNIKEVGGGMEGERYRCSLCGESYFLDYEDMK